MRKPGQVVGQLIALPLGILVTILSAQIWLRFVNIDFEPCSQNGFIWKLLLMFAGQVVIHEWQHLIVHPKWGWSDRSTVGFWPRRVFFHAHYEGPCIEIAFNCCCWHHLWDSQLSR